MGHNQLFYKNPEVDLRLKYRKIFEVSLVIALFFLILLFLSFKNFNSKVNLDRTIDTVIKTIDIPITKQIIRKPPPPRPSLINPSPDEELSKEITIDPTDDILSKAALSDLRPPDPDMDEPAVPFYKLSKKPELILSVKPKYPEIARKAGMEGLVVVEVLIGKNGDVEDVKVVRSHPMLDEAAIAAARKFKFTPGKQRDRIVKVWMSIPLSFKLN